MLKAIETETARQSAINLTEKVSKTPEAFFPVCQNTLLTPNSHALIRGSI